MPAIVRDEVCVHRAGSGHELPSRPTLTFVYPSVPTSPQPPRRVPGHADDVDPDADPTATGDISRGTTIGDLRELIAGLPDDVVLCVGVRDPSHFNSFLGTLPVSAIHLEPCACAAGHVLEMDVPGIT